MKSTIAIILIILLYINFFGILNIPNTILLASLIPFIIVGIGKKIMFRNMFIWFIIGIICNMISCYIYRGQDFLSSFKAIPVYFYVLSFFLFVWINPTLKTLNSVILYLAVIFDSIYIIQFVLLQFGIIFLPLDRDLYSDAGISARFRMVASGLVSLGLFLGCNRYILKKDKFSVLLCVLSFTVIVLMAFRTMIFFSTLLCIVLIFRLQGFNKKTLGIILLGAIIFILLLNIPVLSEKFGYMWDKQFGENAQTLNDKDYIRNVTLLYYLRIHFKSIAEYIFGSGLPYIDHPYYRELEELADVGIYFQDWGLLGLSWMLGIIPVGCMIWYSMKAALLKVSPSFYYIGTWFIYLVISSITTSEFYREGNYVVQALCLYTIYKAHITYKYKLVVSRKYENRDFNISQST